MWWIALWRTPYKKRRVGKKEETVTLEAYHHAYNQEPDPPEPETPDSVKHIFKWFWDLSSQRQQGYSGSLPLSFSEIEAWSRLTATPIRPIEVEMILAMDRTYLAGLSRVREIAERERKEPTR